MKLFRSKYRVKSTRLPYWDYSSDGWYFITICAKRRECIFGEIKNGIMGLNGLGVVAYKCWEEIPKHFPNALLNDFVIMPNHVHGIIVIENPSNPVETQNFASLPNTFGPQSKKLASIIRGYKIGVKKYATINKIPFAWQPSYYDRIINSDEGLNQIHEYIRFNPEKWEIDRNNPTNL